MMLNSSSTLTTHSNHHHHHNHRSSLGTVVVVKKINKQEKMSPQQTLIRHTQFITLTLGLLLVLAPISLLADEPAAAGAAVGPIKQVAEPHAAPPPPPQQPASARSTQPTVDRQLDTPNSSPIVVSQSSASAVPQSPKDSAVSTSSSGNAKAYKPKQLSGSQKKAALASQQNYDKYQLKATNSYHSQTTPVVPSSSSSSSSSSSADSALAAAASAQSSSSSSDHPVRSSDGEHHQTSASSTSSDKHKSVAHKKSNYNAQQVNKASSSFSLLKKLLPSFMTSAGPAAAAAAAAAASAVVDKHQMSHSRSSQPSILAGGADGSVGGALLSKASGKIINLLSSKKSAYGVGAVPDHAPFFIRKPSIDRQASFASGLLSNPLSLGLLFSAPLIPSLLLTPLAIAGLSPAMSAINNFFGDDEEGSSGSSNSSPLSVLTGPSSPLSSILQGSSSSSSSSGSQSGSSPSSSFALQAVQSILGPPASTEKPLFNPGMFASQGIQNAIGSISSAASGSSTTGTGSSSSSSSSSSSPSGLTGSSSQQSNSPIRNFLGGNFIQTAASMISPSFAAPPSSSASNAAAASSADSDDGPGFLQAASDMFDKVSNYMNSDKDITPAASTSGLTTSTAGSSSSSSPLSALVGLSNFSPFQLSSLFASSPLANAAGGSSSSAGTGSGSTGATTQRAGFFSTLKNVYELFSSSFLRRQEVGDSNECQQRLICELHQKAMNSKLFRRSLESNLMELVNIDKNLQEQIKSNPMQARVDAGTKAMLNDFLKATNNFKSGRELVNCAKMFPKCSRAKLLSTANAHLTDPANSKAIGKFSNLMKKMKFKSNQQHQSQWKLRKPSKPNGLSAPILTAQPSNQQYQATDYLQVAPLSSVPIAAGKAASGQMAPADSLKLVQQIMMMSQQQQQQQQQQQAQQVSQYRQPMQYNSNSNNNQQQQQQIYNSPQASIPAYPAASYSPYSQNNQNLYSDSLAPSMYSPSTDVPYFQPADLSASLQSAQQQQPVQQLQNQQQPMMQSNQQLQPQLQNYQQYPTSTSIVPEHIASLNQQQQLQQQQQQQLEKKPLQQQQGIAATAMAA